MLWLVSEGDIMQKLLAKLKSLIKVILSYVPTQLPVGVTAYDAWLKDITDIVGPIADEMSLQWVISNEIMRLAPGRDKISKRYFVKSLRKYAANQIAANKVLELKKKQEEASKAAQVSTLTPAEVTATTMADNGTTGLQQT